MYTEDKVIENVTIDDTGRLHIKYLNRVLRDGEVIAHSIERTILSSESDLSAHNKVKDKLQLLVGKYNLKAKE